MNQRTPASGSSWITARFLAVLLGAAGLSCSPVSAASLNPLAGQILGQVRDAGGAAQMGASVFLYNRYDELVRRGLSNEQGRFAFDALAPDLYSIRVVRSEEHTSELQSRFGIS